MGKPAARLGDMTAHGGVITGPGCPTVLIGKMPAATMGDMHMCPMATPGTPPIPHMGGPIVGPVPPTVLIGKKPAACVGDMAICVGPPSTILPPGCITVLLGQAGGGGGGGGGLANAAQSASTMSGSLKNLSISSKVPETVKLAVLQAAKGLSQAAVEELVQQVEQAFANTEDAIEKRESITISDIADILKKIEAKEGFEAARFFATQIDFKVLTDMTMQFVAGNDTNPKNDPNVMPTRFMILYGADDSKLQCIDKHPDCADGEDHKINVTNLRKGLKLLGHDIAESGPYDDELLKAHISFCGCVMTQSASAAEKHQEEQAAEEEKIEKEKEEKKKKEEERKDTSKKPNEKLKGHTLVESLKQPNPSQSNKADKKMGGVSGNIAGTATGAMGDANNMATGAIAGVNEAAGKAIAGAANAANEAKTQADAVKNCAMGQVNDLKSQVDPVKNDTMGKADALKKQAESYKNDAMNKANELKNTAEPYKNQAEAYKNEAMNKANEYKNQAESYENDTMNKGNEYKNQAESYKNDAMNKGNELKNQGETVKNDTVNSVDKVKNQANDAGKNASAQADNAKNAANKQADDFKKLV
jgi:uncharacterized Zn-binding protein involved in type VI secretion